MVNFVIWSANDHLEGHFVDIMSFQNVPNNLGESPQIHLYNIWLILGCHNVKNYWTYVFDELQYMIVLNVNHNEEC